MLDKPTNCLAKHILKLVYILRNKSTAHGMAKTCTVHILKQVLECGRVASLVLVAYLSVEEISLNS